MFIIFQPFEITNEQIICPSCAEKLEQTFNFKITCLNNENLVKVFHSCKNKSVLILEEVFPIPVLSDFKLKNEDTRVCRFCLKHFVMEKCTALDQMDKDIFLQDLIFKTVSEMVSLKYNIIMALFSNESYMYIFLRIG